VIFKLHFTLNRFHNIWQRKPPALASGGSCLTSFLWYNCSNKLRCCLRDIQAILANRAVVGLEISPPPVRGVNLPKRHRVQQRMTLTIGECSGEKQFFTIRHSLVTSHLLQRVVVDFRSPTLFILSPAFYEVCDYQDKSSDCSIDALINRETQRTPSYYDANWTVISIGYSINPEIYFYRTN
jgi:hypothetical protein